MFTMMGSALQVDHEIAVTLAEAVCELSLLRAREARDPFLKQGHLLFVAGDLPGAIRAFEQVTEPSEIETAKELVATRTALMNDPAMKAAYVEATHKRRQGEPLNQPLGSIEEKPVTDARRS